MKDLRQAIKNGKLLRVIGFDDAPFGKSPANKLPDSTMNNSTMNNSIVNICGAVCAGTRFEGMLWGEIIKDGDNATDVIASMVLGSKFYPQLHLVLLDGIAMGGFNIVNLKGLSNRLRLPCIAVMRKRPDMNAVFRALENFSDCTVRIATIKAAGEIFEMNDFVFQVAGCQVVDAAQALALLTDRGKVPEALRLAHLVGAAVKTGKSSSRA